MIYSPSMVIYAQIRAISSHQTAMKKIPENTLKM